MPSIIALACDAGCTWTTGHTILTIALIALAAAATIAIVRWRRP